MYKKNTKNTHYSLGITFALFICIMASVVVFTMLNENNEEPFESKLKTVGYGDVDTINPLVLESSHKVLDKTNSNIEIAYEINRVYNLDVIYGDGTEAISKSVDAVALYDQDKINSTLLELIESLEKYPINIFKEIELEDYTIEICLVDYFNNDNVALATRDSNNNFRIYLSVSDGNKKIQRAIHHETYHILEYYMKLEFDINELYRNWNKYNPEGFTYEDNIALLNREYVYNLDMSDRTYFVSIYSKVSEKEDRAEVFADTMIADTIPTYYTDKVGAIKGKMMLISEAIEKCFYSVEYGASIYWKRYF